MTPARRRAVIRWVHIIVAIPIIGYIYTPFDALHSFAWLHRWILLPAMVLSGLWMWQGHRLRRLFGRAA